MNTPTIVMLVTGLAAALLLGPRLAASAEKREKLHGGSASHWLNLIACCAFVALPLTVLPGLIAGWISREHGPLLQVALALLAVTFVSLIAWAAVELPARAKAAPTAQRTALNTWTQEDARKSGL